MNNTLNDKKTLTEKNRTKKKS